MPAVYRWFSVILTRHWNRKANLCFLLWGKINSKLPCHYGCSPLMPLTFCNLMPPTATTKILQLNPTYFYITLSSWLGCSVCQTFLILQTYFLLSYFKPWSSAQVKYLELKFCLYVHVEARGLPQMGPMFSVPHGLVSRVGWSSWAVSPGMTSTCHYLVCTWILGTKFLSLLHLWSHS